MKSARSYTDISLSVNDLFNNAVFLLTGNHKQPAMVFCSGKGMICTGFNGVMPSRLVRLYLQVIITQCLAHRYSPDEPGLAAVVA
jgi:hypothetical protein